MATDTTPDEARRDQIAQLAESLYSDPEIRPAFQALVKKKHPQAVIPEYDARVASAAVLEDVRKEKAEIVRLRETEENRRDLDARRRAIMEDPELRITSAELPAVEKLMQEGFADGVVVSHVAAARLYRQQQQVAPAASPSILEVPGVMGAGGDDYKGIVTDPDGWARKMAHRIIGDFRNGRGGQWLS